MVKVIGLCGSIGAGKDVVSKFIAKEYGYVQITVGDIVRAFCKNMGLEPTRENCDQLSKKKTDEEGPEFWMQQIVDTVQSAGIQRVIVDGVRTPNNNEVLVNAFGDDYILLKVDADPAVRFERLKSRLRAGDPQTLEEFKKQEEFQNEHFQVNTTFNQAKAVIDNSTTLEELYDRVRAVVGKPEFKPWFE